jgi:formylglycine-generating enzyme required for sulfatase activity
LRPYLARASDEEKRWCPALVAFDFCHPSAVYNAVPQLRTSSKHHGTALPFWNMSDIFISYASEDRAKAQLLAQVLGAKGWSVWWDPKIPPGKRYHQVIEEALDNARCVVVLWSKISAKKAWVITEAAEGNRRGILIPALIEDDVRIPLEFRLIESARLTDWPGEHSGDSEFDNFLLAIEDLLGKPPNAEAKSTSSEALSKVRGDEAIAATQHQLGAQMRQPEPVGCDIFISYRRGEQPIAIKLADALRREGWTVWWDYGNLRGDRRFADVIERVLNETKCVVVLWSKRSVHSQYVQDEATYALNRGKLVPVALEAIEKLDLPFRFEGIHTPLLINWDGTRDSTEFRKLVNDIRAHIGELARPTANPAETNAQAFNLRDSAPAPLDVSATGTLKPGTIFRDTLKDDSLGPEMVVIPAASFQMGDIRGTGHDREKPVHWVHIPKPFAIGRYQVTFDEYEKYAKLTGRWVPLDEGWGRGRRPIINISWDDAEQYTEWLSAQTGTRYRLPTEAEWEYAARSGGKDEIWAGTSDKNTLVDYAVFNKQQTEIVGNRRPNGLGLYDMSGNVYEWVQDLWHDNYHGAPQDGSAWLQGGAGVLRVIRGGSWHSIVERLRSSLRDRKAVGHRGTNVGFRLAQDIS